MSKKLHNQANALIIQRQQTNAAQNGLNDAKQALDDLEDRSQVNQVDLDNLLALSEAAVAQGLTLPKGVSLDMEVLEIEETRLPIAPLDHVSIEDEEDWGGYLAKVQAYAARNELTLHKDPFAHLMSPTQKIALEKRIREDFSLTAANCDKFDYMIAGTCGLIGGLVDILFVGMPGEGALTEFTDDVTDGFVQKFAGWFGWKGPREGRDPTASAIGFLERTFKVNYDQSTGNGENGVGGVFKMSMDNHHIKSLGHSPDIVGLFFSILGQFTNTSYFVDGGRVISIDTESFELKGSTFASKVFSGFVNWLGHLVSDMAGSSGAKGRGAGIPIPFFSLLQFIDVGEFGQHRQSFAKLAVQVFEQGYDFRHGMALAIPVMVTELLTRIMWTFKRRFSHGLAWGECLPSANNPELRRMLLVGHGTLCIVDGADAALRSGGEMINFMLRANLIAWARFGSLALKELRASYSAGSLDTEAVDEYLEKEYQRLLS
ncbi:MAG: hypothetical protein RIB30_02560 [Thalassospira sp.]|uniref:hypothetical protein n=1 Tax=Thalassospira sp. TaxID=1912094 RepID=UPI0032EECB64